MRSTNLGLARLILFPLTLVACGGSVDNGGKAGAGGASAGSGGTSGGHTGGTGFGGTGFGGGGVGGGFGGLGGTGAGGSGGLAGSAAGGGSGGVFTTAPHDPLPQIPTQGGRLLEHVQIVTVTFAGYQYETQAQAFDDFVVGSNWITTVGKDYGIGTGTSVAKIVLPDQAPTTISDDEIQVWLAGKIQDGTIPAPPALDNDYLYVVYYPSTTQISLQGSLSCDFFGGYHNSVNDGVLHFSYAVLPTCLNQPGPPEFALEISASHEIIEAATDADPLVDVPGYMLNDFSSPWSFVGGETADLCVGAAVQEGGFALQRVWSNTAAAADQNPCVPSSGDYYNVSISPNEPVALSPGQSTTFTLTGWSISPMPDWFVQASPYAGTFKPDAQLDTSFLNNGKTATLTVTVPPNTPSQSYGSVVVLSAKSQNDYTMWPAVVYVP